MQSQLSSGEVTSPEETAAEAKRHRVFIVDDHPPFRFCLARLIEREPDLEVCGEAESASEALSKLRSIEADLAIIDI